MEYINFEHNETAAELVRAAYDTPRWPLYTAMAVSRTSMMASASRACWWISATACAISPRMQT